MHATSTPSRPRRRPARAGAGLAATLALTLAACGGDDGGTDTTGAAGDGRTGGGAAAEIHVTDAWARSSAEGQTRGAAYMVVHGGREDDRLVAVSVPGTVAAAAEIHETVAAGDTAGGDPGHGDGDSGTGGDQEGDPPLMTMREVEALDVPAGETVAFEPGGHHLMLVDLVEPLESGDEIQVDLDFEVAGPRTVTAYVRDG